MPLPGGAHCPSVSDSVPGPPSASSASASPNAGRSEFVAAGLAGFAAFSLLELFAALAPTFVGDVLYQPSHAVQGAGHIRFFVACYTDLIIPVVGVGVASAFIGDFRAVLAFSILLAILCVFSLASIRKTY